MLRFKQMTRWTLRDSLFSMGIFFAVYSAVILATIIIFKFAIDISEGEHTFGIGSGIIFLFIMGIVIFAQYLRVGLANGVSRKTVFAAFIVCAAVLSAGAVVGEWLLSMLAGLMLGVKDNIYSLTLAGPAAGLPLNLLSALCSGIAVSALGMFIGGAYYRMGKLAKVAVSISVPVVLVGGISAAVSLLPKSAIDFLVNQIILPVTSFFTGSPWTYMAGCLIMAAVLLLFVYLLLRRAPAKAAS